MSYEREHFGFAGRQSRGELRRGLGNLLGLRYTRRLVTRTRHVLRRGLRNGHGSGGEKNSGINTGAEQPVQFGHAYLRRDLETGTLTRKVLDERK